MTHPHMTKVPEYPRPHLFDYGWSMPVESAAARAATILPIITYDEGQGAMSAYESNPQNTAFTQSATANCFPTSKVQNVFAELTVSMSKVMLETDKVPAVIFKTATIHSAFNETGDAKDEISTLDLNEVLELQVETTDRQMGPLYNAIDMHDYKSNTFLDMPADQAFLDTDVELEAVAFSSADYYDCLHFHTTGPKLRSVCTPLKSHTLTKQHPYKKIYFSQQSNTKYLNPYTFLAGLIFLPQMFAAEQIGEVGDTTIETSVLHCSFRVRYNEWNHEYNHSVQ